MIGVDFRVGSKFELDRGIGDAPLCVQLVDVCLEMGNRIGVDFFESVDVSDGLDGFGSRASAFAIILHNR